MIINQKAESKLEIIGEVKTKRATINENELAKLQHLLTKGLYSDPVGAVIVEWTNNAVDAVVAAGKNPVDHPVMVEVGTNGYNNYFFRVSDKGIGLTKDEFEDILMNYLTSTKTSSNEYIGSFGLGAKSFLALDRPAIFTCRKDGKEWKFTAYQGPEFVQYDLIYEGETTEENGVICEIAIKEYREFFSFKYKATQRLAYYDTVALMIEGRLVQNTIHRNEFYQTSSLINNGNLHMSLKDVYYPIDFSKLGIQPIQLPICLRFELNEGIQPTPSREAIIYSEDTKELILNKIKALGNHFLEEYNKGIETVKTFVQAIPYFESNNFNLDIKDRKLRLDNFFKSLKLQPEKVRVEGIKYYQFTGKSALAECFRGFSTIIEKGRNGRFKLKNPTTPYNAFIRNKEIVRVDGLSFRGAFKRFMIGDASMNAVFVSGKPERLTLKQYRKVHNLLGKDRSQWRDRIKEFQMIQDQIVATFIDGEAFRDSDEFKQFTASSMTDPTYVSKKVERTKDQVVIAYQKKVRQVTFSKRVAQNIDSIHKLPYLLVLVPEDEDEEEFSKEVFNKIKTVRFVKISPRDLKKIPKIHNLVTMEEFVETKPFIRFATSLLAYDTVAKYEEFVSKTGYNLEGFQFAKHQKTVNELKNYIPKRLSPVSTEAEEWILQHCKENNFWEHPVKMQIDELNKVINELEFLTVFEDYNSLTEQEQKVYRNTIAQIMLFRKKHKGQFDEYEVVPKKPEPQPVINTVDDLDTFPEPEPELEEMDGPVELLEVIEDYPF